MLPSAFVAGLLLGAILAPLSSLCRTLYVGTLLLYAIAMLISCVNRNPLSWLLTWLGAILTHDVYGFNFLVGFFINRLPDEVHNFDHASQTSGKKKEG